MELQNVSYVRLSPRSQYLKLKAYKALFQSVQGKQYSRRTFKTASQALTYGQSVAARYKRLLATQIKPESPEIENAEAA